MFCGHAHDCSSISCLLEQQVCVYQLLIKKTAVVLLVFFWGGGVSLRGEYHTWCAADKPIMCSSNNSNNSSVVLSPSSVIW